MPSSPALKRWAKLVRPYGAVCRARSLYQHSSARAKDRLADHLFGLCDSELRQNCGVIIR